MLGRGACVTHSLRFWCDTCWPLGGQHGSQAILFHIPGSCCLTVWDQTEALPTELCRLGTCLWGVFVNYLREYIWHLMICTFTSMLAWMFKIGQSYGQLGYKYLLSAVFIVWIILFWASSRMSLRKTTSPLRVLMPVTRPNLTCISRWFLQKREHYLLKVLLLSNKL